MNVEILEGYKTIDVLIKCPKVTADIRKLESFIHSYSKEIPCTKSGASYLVDINDILYFESVDKQSFLYTEDDVYELPLKLYKIEEILASSGFIRSAKSQIINTYKISSLRPDFGSRIEVTMAGGEKLIVSRQYAPLLKERLGL